MEGFQVGIIGMGLMGKMYARRLSEAGWKVNACDRSDKFSALKEEFEGRKNVNILEDGHLVSRISDWIIYNVEAERIDHVVGMYGKSSKLGAIVGGQTSCKAPEIAAFEKYLPQDVDIVSCHSLHGPGVDPKGQPLVMIQHRDKHNSLKKAEHVLSCFGSKIVRLSAAEHDRITADTQAVTHAAFLSMGAAWSSSHQFPWENPRYVGGIENVKINVTLRIYSNKWHVYAGLAIFNPSAKAQINQYATSVTELYKLMLAGQWESLESRVRRAGEAIFGDRGGKSNGHREKEELLLNDEVLNRFTLGELPKAEERVKNNHLSLLAMVDSWYALSINPYDHMICSTPLFRLWLGSAEYLFRNPALLSEALDTAINDNTFRADDLEFNFAARAWSELVSRGDMLGYQTKFESHASYFAPRFKEATEVGNEMIRTILARNGETK